MKCMTMLHMLIYSKSNKSPVTRYDATSCTKALNNQTKVLNRMNGSLPFIQERACCSAEISALTLSGGGDILYNEHFSVPSRAALTNTHSRLLCDATRSRFCVGDSMTHSAVQKVVKSGFLVLSGCCRPGFRQHLL